MLGYTRTLPADAALALQAANTETQPNNIIIAKDYLGYAYLPEWDFNGVGDLEPGLGYQVKIEEAVDFAYLPDNQDYETTTNQP